MLIQVDLEELRAFLVHAHRAGYAGGEARAVEEQDGSHTIVVELGDWKSHDNFLGGEPFGGREVVLWREQPVWLIVYYGRITDPAYQIDAVYPFLRKALRASPPDTPVRGPRTMTEGQWEYENSMDGDIRHFHGYERIGHKSDVIYEGFYAGGLVSIRSG